MFPKKLMLCVETPKALEICAAEVAWLARRLDAGLAIYHALRPYWNELSSYKEWKRSEARKIEELASGPTFAGLDVPVVCDDVSRDLVDGIVRAASDLGADTVAVPTHARRGLERLVVGSVAESVIRSCRIPVLTFDLERVPTAPDALAFDHVVAPVDFSGPSEAALERAAALALRLECAVTALHAVEVIDLLAGFGALNVDAEEMRRHLLADVGDRLDRLAARAEKATRQPVQTRTCSGGLVDAVREIVGEHAHPLVVMATAGRDSLGDRILGSRTERIIRAAGCSVLSLPQ